MDDFLRQSMCPQGMNADEKGSSMRRAFVTGSTGFIGANLVRILLEAGVEVRALARDGADLSSLQGLRLDLRRGDLFDHEALRGHLQGCDACFHLAAAYARPDPAELYRINAGGTRCILETAAEAGVGVIVHTSTIGTLSRPGGASAGDGLLRETDRRLAEGASHYVKSKFQGEEEALQLAARGAPVVIVHPSAPVGAWDRVPTVSGKRIVQVLKGVELRYPLGRINHVAVRDVARGMLLAAELGRPGEHYLLASQEGNLTRDEFVQLVTTAAGIPPPRPRRRFSFWPWRRKGRTGLPSGGPATLACDPSRSVKELGLPQTPLAEAFSEAVRWFREHGYAP
jgi:dihydroflavonol-4-reductase